MLNGWAERPMYLACGATDLRKSIDSLAAQVQQAFRHDPCGPALFVVCNRERDKVKILEWEVSGFWLHYKRLERGRFPWPAAEAAPLGTVDARQLHWLLAGLAWEQPQAHRALRGRRIV